MLFPERASTDCLVAALAASLRCTPASDGAESSQSLLRMLGQPERHPVKSAFLSGQERCVRERSEWLAVRNDFHNFLITAA